MKREIAAEPMTRLKKLTLSRWALSVALLSGACSEGTPRSTPGLEQPDAARAAASTFDGGQIAPEAGCTACDATADSAVENVQDAAAQDAAARDAAGQDAAGQDAAGQDAASGVALGANGRPPGVALCYSAESEAHPSTAQFWDILRRGELDAREANLQALQAAAEAAPKEEEHALLLGLASLWRMAEPLFLESLNPLLTLETITTSRSSLERAYELCPTDHRIAAWLAPIKIRMGRMTDDAALVADGFAVLDKGIAHYPGFVLFSKLLVYADLPASDPDFLKAVDAVRENAVYCGDLVVGLSRDPACRNHPRASHNIEGASVFMGDMYAKAQDRAAALAAYSAAKLSDTWSSWDYQSLLEERIQKLDARMRAAATTDTSDDLEPAWASTIQCSLCHRD